MSEVMHEDFFKPAVKCRSVMYVVLCILFHCVVLYILFQWVVLCIVCKCVLYYRHRVSTQLQLTNISYPLI